MLHNSFRRLGRLFISFERPWLTDCGIIQKACAWYLANGKPGEEESNRLLETLHGFTVSACLLSEWNELTHNMQAFFRTQEKELKRLFDYEQERERKHKEHEERLTAEGTGYCLTIGEGEIYGVTYPQIEELYRVMGRLSSGKRLRFSVRLKITGNTPSVSERTSVCMPTGMNLTLITVWIISTRTLTGCLPGSCSG